MVSLIPKSSLSQSKLVDNFYLSGFQRVNNSHNYGDGAIPENYSFGFDIGTNFFKNYTTVTYGVGVGINYTSQAQTVIGYGGFNSRFSSDRTHILNNINLQINPVFKSLLFSKKQKIRFLVSMEFQFGLIDNSKLASVITYREEDNRIEKTWIKDQTRISYGGSVGLEYPFKIFDVDFMYVYLKRSSGLLSEYIDSSYLRLRFNVKLKA